MRVSDRVRELVAVADQRHEEIDRELERQLRELLASRGGVRDDQSGGAGTPRVVTRPARKGEMQAALRALFADDQERTLQDVMTAVGKSRSAVYAALQRMTKTGEFEALGGGVYRRARASSPDGDSGETRRPVFLTEPSDSGGGRDV